VGGICMACTMPGFPDKYMPFMDEAKKAKTTEIPARFTYGPIYKFLRNWEIRHNGDKEPAWRRRSRTLETGYEPRHYARAGR
jgi:hydrogenase small subunit